MEKFIKYLTFVLIVIVIVLIVGFIVVGFFTHVFDESPNTRETILTIATLITGFATLLLVYATFRLAENSREQEQRSRQFALENEQQYRRAELEKEERYRQDQRDREDRERKERLLNEIQDWITDINANINRILTGPLNDIDRISTLGNDNYSTVYMAMGLDMIYKYQNEKYFKSIAHEIGPNVETAIMNLDIPIREFGKAILVFCKKMKGIPVEPNISNEEMLTALKQLRKDDFVRNSDDLILVTLKELTEGIEKAVNSINIIISEIAKAKLALLKKE